MYLHIRFDSAKVSVIQSVGRAICTLFTSYSLISIAVVYDLLPMPLVTISIGEQTPAVA
jgi:hypothetical protein